MVAEHSDLLTGWPPNQHAVRRAELKWERSGSIGRFSPSTAPDFAPPSSETCVFLQEDAPGAGPLSFTRPDCSTSHPAAHPCKTGILSCEGKVTCAPCEATRQPARRQVVGSASVFQSTITHRNALSRLEGISPKVDGSTRHFYSPSSLDRKRALRDVQATLCDPPGESHAHRQ